ncbi:GHKL domain-containing protein [Candidatus Pseudoruminococcus sp.]|uniref:GHKL domain-containing protein n=1 Tax=Candidatus Pseudoruminococcus sp. TaxID=3101048 RepID=UPI00399AE387
MSIELQLIINVIVSTMPYCILAYCPMWKYLRCKKWLVIVLIIISEFVFVNSSLLCLKNGINPRYSDVITSAICLVVYSLCVKVNFFKLVFFYFFTAAYTMIIRGLSVFITGLIFPDSTLYYSIENSIIQIVFFMLALPLILILYNKTAERILDSPESDIWKTIWLVPAFTIFLIMMFTGSFDNDITKSWKFFITRICLLICTFVIYYVLLRSFDILRKSAMLEERAKQAEAINDLQKAQYNLILKHIEETRIARHDLRQHLNLIQAYIDSGDQEALKNYLEVYKKTLPIDTSQIYCKNYAIDVLVRYYAEQARQSNIEFYTNIELPKELSISEPDLCVMLGNLIENALEACQRKKSGEKFIRICGKLIGENSISITIDNSCEEKPIKEGKEYRSSKRNDVGIGLISVKNIVEKYDGITDFKYENGVFFASILLNTA